MLLAAVLTRGAAQAFDETKYPDLKGQWNRTARRAGTSRPRQAKRRVTPEYRAIYEANVKRPGRGRPGHRPDLHLPLARHAAGR